MSTEKLDPENILNGNNNRNIHQETEFFLDILEENTLIDEFSCLTHEKAFKRSEEIARLCNDEQKFSVKTKDLTIPSSRPDGVPIRVYSPPVLGLKPAVVVYFHGVGMMWGNLSTAEHVCAHISQLASCIVVSVDYRTPPQHSILESLEDGIWSVRWVTFNKGLLGAKHNSSLGVMGDSGGALIAAQLAQELPQISFQVLVYPKLTMSKFGESYCQSSNSGPLCTLGDINWFIAEAINENATDKQLARCNPGNRINCCNLPPALFVIAEYDLMKDDAHEYIKKLKECHVKTTIVSVKGAYHGFFHLPGVFKTCTEKAYARVADLIKSHSDYSHLQLLN